MGGWITLDCSVQTPLSSLLKKYAEPLCAGSSVILSILLLTVGLWNATLLPSEKGFYAFAFLLALFAAVAVQKNIRDAQAAERR